MSEPHTIPTDEDKKPSRVPVTSQALLDMRFPVDVNLLPECKRVAFVVWDWVEGKPKQRGNTYNA